MSKRLETCTEVRVSGVVYSHKILVVGVGVSLSTHGDSGNNDMETIALCTEKIVWKTW